MWLYIMHGLLCPRLRGKGGGASHQRGGNVFPRPQGRLFGFIQTGGAAAHHNPLNLLHLFEPSEPSRPQAPSGIQPARLHFITQKEQAQSLLFSFGIYPRKYFTPASKRGWYLFPQIFFPIFSPRRSVWPILPRTLPSGLVMPSTAQEEPLGLKRLS